MATTLRLTKEYVEAHNARVRNYPAKQPNPLPTEPRPAAPPPPPPKKVDAADPNAEWLANQLEAKGVKVEREYYWCRGRKFRADVAIPQYRLAIEVDGAVHRIKNRWKADIGKRQEAILQAWTLLPVSTQQVRNGEGVRLVQQVILTLKSGGIPF